MKLADIVSAAGLAGYAEVALVLFLLAFVSIVFQAASKKRSAEWERAASLPLTAGDERGTGDGMEGTR